ncbi:putative NACHT and WD repeat domain-containing protein 1 isoform X 3 [Apostichopus japonicus]|uniref:Putative NACHT and WD repeat domain-containing protein 1 isoform X 3 n=1 Tax=Stichopus japonicus TaxID=307972 RepID=A0A2G8LR93_STIJA|nr:putative NACHT and WD repeat domain-containing protein 1 isoform X 3 [Apostichopus japonicus]
MQFLLGQRYGYRPIPAKILSSEFDILMKYVSNEDDENLIKKWYLHDKNSLPSEYVLQPVTEDWENVSSKLAVVLQSIVTAANEEGSIDDSEKKKYFSSVTQLEVEAALDADSPTSHCFGFYREITDLFDHLDDPDAKRYFDADENGNPIPLIESHLEEMKCSYIPSRLHSSNLHKLQVKWKKSGISASSPEYHQYLQQLKSNFIQNVKGLTLKAIAQEEFNASIAENALLVEIIHHANFCVKRCEVFHGCMDTIDEIMGKICTKDVSKPVVIHGPSGSGKTSVMAKLAQISKSSSSDVLNVVIRFLGTSSKSSSILSVLKSVAEQICAIYDIPLPDNSTLNNFISLITYFPSLLTRVAELPEKGALLILLDSVDQLENSFRAHTCKWLPRVCPKNVQIILSTLPDMYGILEWLKEILISDDCFIGMTPLAEGTGVEIAKHWMSACNRKVTADQFDILKRVFKKCPQPLFLKLQFDEARRWKSYTVVSEEQLAIRIDEAIWKLFEGLERQFGKILVSHAVGYICASRNGLTNEELLHVLSLDDEVLDEIYQYWPPPDPKEVAVPTLVWARLRYELEEYLVERQAEGKTVLVLYHRQFTMAGSEKYLKDPAKQIARHKVLADFFSGKWAHVEKMLKLTQQGKTLNPMRMVPSQPLRFENEYNRRKLRLLPYHMTLCGKESHEDLCKNIYGNFDFLDTYLKAFSTQQLIEEITMSLENMEESSSLKPQVELLRDTLRLAKPSMEFVGNETPLSIELLGRLGGVAENQDFSGCLQPLLEGARHSCNQSMQLQLIPLKVCFPRPGGPLRSTLVGHKGGIQDVHVNSSSTMLASASADGTVRIWDINSDDMIHVLVAKSCISGVQISSDDRWVVAITQKGVYSLESGTTLASSQARSKDVAFTCAGFDPTTGIVLGATEKGSMWAWSIDGRKDLTLELTVHAEVNCAITHILLRHSKTNVCFVFATEAGQVGFGEYSLEDDGKFSIRKVCSEGGLGAVSSICLSDDSSSVWVASGPSVFSFDADSNLTSAKYIVKGYTTQILSLKVVTSDSSFLIAGHKDDVMVFWRLGGSSGPNLLGVMEGLNADVSHLSFIDTGTTDKMLVSCSTQLPFVKLWNLNLISSHLANNRTFFYKSGPMELTPDYKYVVYSAPSMDEEDDRINLRIWNSVSGMVSELEARNDEEISFHVIDGSRFLVGTKSGEILVINFQTRQVEDIMQSTKEGPVLLMCLNRAKSLLGCMQLVGRSLVGSIWDMRLKECRQMIDFEGEEIFCLAVTLKGDLLMAGAFGGILIGSMKGTARKLAFKSTKPGYATNALALNSSERLLAVAPNIPKTDIWDLKTEKIVLTLRRTGIVQCLCFSRKDKYLFTGSQDKKLKMFSVSTGSLLKDIYVYANLVTVIATQDMILGGIELGQVLAFRIHDPVTEEPRKQSRQSQLCSLW